MIFSHKIAKICTFLTGSLLGVGLFFAANSVPTLLAQGATPVSQTSQPETASETTLDRSCKQALPAILEKEKKTFIDFMNQHFNNAAPNSALIEKGVNAFNNYKNNLLAAERNFLLQSKRQGSAIAEISGCDAMVREQFIIADTVFQSFVEQTAVSKKATALTEKLHSINGKLGTLLTLVREFDSYFVSFNNRLPGYITTSCIKEGSGL